MVARLDGSEISSRALATFRASLDGYAVTPCDADYQAIKRGCGTTPTDDRQPVLVVRAQTPNDVARAIDLARYERLDLSVRSGGHDMLGASTAATGVVLDLADIAAAELDPSTRLLQVGGGARARKAYEIGAPFGLAPILGMSPSVGIGGLLLGGGIGWVSGSFGAAVDHVVDADMVTADGRFVKASAIENPDLFWALRGGGGNFGVVTRFTLHMQPLAQVLAGTLNFEISPDRLMTFMWDFLAESGDSLDVEMSFSLGPRATTTVRLCWCGDLEAGHRVVDRLRKFAPASRDTVKTMPLVDFVSGYASAGTMLLRGGEFNGLTKSVIAAVAEVIEKGGPSDCGIGLLHYMHGALCRVPTDSTPFVRPEGHILFNVVAPARDGTVSPEKQDWAIATWKTLKSVGASRTYPNYLCDTYEPAVKAAYGTHYERLREIKRRFDPENFFRNNRNIRP